MCAGLRDGSFYHSVTASAVSEAVKVIYGAE